MLSCAIWAVFWSILIQNGIRKPGGGGGHLFLPRMDLPLFKPYRISTVYLFVFFYWAIVIVLRFHKWEIMHLLESLGAIPVWVEWRPVRCRGRGTCPHHSSSCRSHWWRSQRDGGRPPGGWIGRPPPWGSRPGTGAVSPPHSAPDAQLGAPAAHPPTI